MKIGKFGVPAILLAVSAALLVTAVAGSSGTAAAESYSYGCGSGNDSRSFAATLPQLTPGRSGTNVMGLQKALMINGYDLVGTGYYGTKTLAAVRDYQAKHGIRASGIVGQQTWQALVGVKRPCFTKNGHAEVPAFGVRPGDRDPRHLSEIESRLYRIVGVQPNLPYEESYYGSRWQAVVKDFQRANGIKASGIVGELTWRALNRVISIEGTWTCGC